MIILIWSFHTFWPECQLHFEPDAIGEIFSDCYLYNKGPSIPELRFVATVTIGGRVKFVPAV